MCEVHSKHDLYARIEELCDGDASVPSVLSALEQEGYEVEIDMIFGIGITYTTGDESVTCYHPKLSIPYNQTADP